MKVTFEKPTQHKFESKLTMQLLDMLVGLSNLHSEALAQLKTELAYQRRLQGVYNVLFGVVVGVLVVMGAVLCNSLQV